MLFLVNNGKCRVGHILVDGERELTTKEDAIDVVLFIVVGYY
jgi:hypothetical protein